MAIFCQCVELTLVPSSAAFLPLFFSSPFAVNVVTRRCPFKRIPNVLASSSQLILKPLLSAFLLIFHLPCVASVFVRKNPLERFSLSVSPYPFRQAKMRPKESASTYFVNAFRASLSVFTFIMVMS